MQYFVLRAKPFISGGIALMFLCIRLYFGPIILVLTSDSIMLESLADSTLENIRLNGLSTSHAAFRGEAGSPGPWESGQHGVCLHEEFPACSDSFHILL